MDGQSCPKAYHCHHSYWLWADAKTFGKNESFTVKYEARVLLFFFYFVSFERLLTACYSPMQICQISRVPVVSRSFSRLISIDTLVTRVIESSAYSVVVVS